MGKFVRRVSAVLGLLIAVAGFAAFVTAAVAVWELKAETNRRTEDIASKAHAAVNAADHGVAFVSEVVDQGERDLKQAREQPTGEVQRVNPFVQRSAREASAKLAGSVERANAAVLAASDTVVVAETALKLFESDEQLKNWFSIIQPEHLSQTQLGLNMASRELKNVRTVLGIPITVGTMPTAEQLMTVEAALRQARLFIERLNQIVVTARERINETKRTADEWVQRIAIGVTAIGVLGAMGQFFMARFFWRVLRCQPA